MSVFFAAPYPALQTTSVLPDPEFGNTRASESSLQVKRSMLGKVKTYIQSQTKQVVTLQFLVTRKKEFEIDQFLTAYHTTDWLITDHNGVRWVAKLVGDPIRRAAVGMIDKDNDRTGDEELDITFEFLATKLP